MEQDLHSGVSWHTHRCVPSVDNIHFFPLFKDCPATLAKLGGFSTLLYGTAYLQYVEYKCMIDSSTKQSSFIYLK